MLKLIATCLFLFLPSSVFATGKFNVHLGGFYSDRIEKTNGQDTANVTNTIYDLGAGMVFPNSVYVGLKYYQYNEAWGDDNELDKTVSGPGLSLGFFHNSGFTIIASYLWDPVKKFPNGSNGTVTYEGGTGTIFDIAYLVKSGNVSFGPQISQAIIDYKKIKSSAGSANVTASTKDSFLFPQVVVYFDI